MRDRGAELPEFAAFDLLKDEEGRELLRRYFERYLSVAVAHGSGFVLESPTWRASTDWGARIGYDRERLAEANRAAIALCAELRRKHRGDGIQVVTSGCIGPRGDGYDPGSLMGVDEARAYHAFQAAIFAEAEVDLVTAITMTNVPEAAGLAFAARDADLPVAISFTVETDGRLPTGQTLDEAIETVDRETGDAPAYYLINCAHPTHFESAIAPRGAAAERIRGVRGNASKQSHAELDEATELDEGDPRELAADTIRLRAVLPRLAVLGGCCGTDQRHVASIAAAWHRTDRRVSSSAP